MLVQTCALEEEKVLPYHCQFRTFIVVNSCIPNYDSACVVSVAPKLPICLKDICNELPYKNCFNNIFYSYDTKMKRYRGTARCARTTPNTRFDVCVQANPSKAHALLLI